MPGGQDGSSMDVEYTGSGAGQQVLSNMELTRIIISFLKDITLSEAGVEISDDEIPELPPKWTSIFARLARVNRAFFHASIDVLWEILGSVKPLLELLRPDTQESGELLEPVSFYSGVEPHEWERFDIYSGRVKTLVLKSDTGPGIDPCWFMFLSTARTRPLFPSVKRLFLSTSRKQPRFLLPSVRRPFPKSYSNLPTFVAFTVLPQLKFLSFDNDTSPNEPTADPEVDVALYAGLAAHSCLTMLNVAVSLSHISGSSVIENISRIHSLTSLHLRIDDPQDDFENLKSLEKIEMLERLVIIQAVAAHDDTLASQFPPLVDISAPIARVSKQTRLRELEVRASTKIQFLVAAHLSPRSLETLSLEILPYSHNEQMVLIPHILAIHASRNPSLQNIWVDCPEALPPIEPESIEHMRGDSRYNKTKAFLTALGNLVDLACLSITEIPIFSVDINIEMLKVLPKLQQLKNFVFRATSMTSLETDELVLPILDSLEEVSGRNPLLIKFETNMDMTQMPTMPEDYVSTHNLEDLLIPMESLREGEDLVEASFAADETFLLARYIDRLFPFLKSLTSVEEPLVDQQLWKPVEKQVFFSQQIRRDVERLKA